MSRHSRSVNSRYGVDLPLYAPLNALWIAGAVSAVLVCDLLWAIYVHYPESWKAYGWALYMLAPAMWGFFIPMILGWKVERLLSDSMRVTVNGALMVGSVAILVQWEVLMALPVLWGISAIGALIGYAF
jgi:hypothetical protein